MDELEVKFFVNDLGALEARLKELGAVLEQERTLEVNLRFDTPDRSLGNAFQALRLRKDTQARLTFKGPSRNEEGVRARQEIEFVVSDYDAAWAFLHALGYEVTVMYEKYRAQYNLGGVHVTLDELPYGNFAEIEGPDTNSIFNVHALLGLDWNARILESYLLLFENYCNQTGLRVKDLSFENFRHVAVNPSDLGVRPADR